MQMGERAVSAAPAQAHDGLPGQIRAPSDAQDGLERRSPRRGASFNRSFPQPTATSSNARPSKPKAFLHRFAAAAAVRYRAIHRNEVEDIVALDIALKRNELNWFELLPEEVSAPMLHKLYYATGISSVTSSIRTISSARATVRSSSSIACGRFWISAARNTPPSTMSVISTRRNPQSCGTIELSIRAIASMRASAGHQNTRIGARRAQTIRGFIAGDRGPADALKHLSAAAREELHGSQWCEKMAPVPPEGAIVSLQRRLGRYGPALPRAQ